MTRQKPSRIQDPIDRYAYYGIFAQTETPSHICIMITPMISVIDLTEAKVLIWRGGGGWLWCEIEPTQAGTDQETHVAVQRCNS